MITQYFANQAQAKLDAGIGSGTLSISVQAGYGNLFGTTFPKSGILQEFDANGRVTYREMVTITARPGTADIFTVTRAVDPCPQAWNSTTQVQTAFAFTAEAILTVIFSAKDYKSFLDEINLKLDKAGGLRTGMGASLQLTEIDATGAEIKKAITTTTSVLLTELLQVIDPSTRARKEITYQNFSTAIASSSNPSDFSLPAGEDFASFPMPCYIEEAYQTFLSYSDGGGIVSANPNIGDVTARTKKGAMIIGNGTSISSLTIHLWKIGAPTDNFTVRVETDNAGSPSGTLAHANASGTIAGTTVTTGVVSYAINFTGSFTLTDLTKYHVVFGRVNAVDPSNYYRVHCIKATHRFHKSSNYNGTTWSDATGETIAFNLSGRYTRVVCKTIANTLVSTNYDGFTTEIKNTGEIIKVKRGGIIIGFSGLVEGQSYYTTNTPGTISTTAGTNVCYIGTAKSSTELNALYREDNEFTYLSGQTAEVIGLFSRGGGPQGFTYLAKQRETIFVTHSQGAGSLYKNNTVIWTWAYIGTSTRTTTVEMYPGDVLIGNQGVDTYSPTMTVSKIVRTALLGTNNV